MEEELSISITSANLGTFEYIKVNDLKTLNLEQCCVLEGLIYKGYSLVMLIDLDSIKDENSCATEVYRYLRRQFLVITETQEAKIRGTAYLLCKEQPMSEAIWLAIKAEIQAKKQKKAPEEVNAYIRDLEQKANARFAGNLALLKLIGGLCSIEQISKDAAKYGDDCVD